jgi:hypothetical protein
MESSYIHKFYGHHRNQEHRDSRRSGWQESEWPVNSEQHMLQSPAAFVHYGSPTRYRCLSDDEFGRQRDSANGSDAFSQWYSHRSSSSTHERRPSTTSADSMKYNRQPEIIGSPEPHQSHCLKPSKRRRQFELQKNWVCPFGAQECDKRYQEWRRYAHTAAIIDCLALVTHRSRLAI